MAPAMTDGPSAHFYLSKEVSKKKRKILRQPIQPQLVHLSWSCKFKRAITDHSPENVESLALKKLTEFELSHIGARQSVTRDGNFIMFIVVATVDSSNRDAEK